MSSQFPRQQAGCLEGKGLSHTDMDPRFGRALGQFAHAGGENKNLPERPKIRPENEAEDLDPDSVVGYGTD